MNTAPRHDLFHHYQEADADLMPTFREQGMDAIIKRPIPNTVYLRGVERKIKPKGKVYRLDV